MMQLRLVAKRPNPDTAEDLIVEERAWRPARSLMAIANQKFAERGNPLVSFSDLEDIDDCIGHGIDSDESRQLGVMIEEVLSDPFAICDYGMTTDIIDGETVYTYPTEMCTAYLEDVETGDFFSNLDVPNIVGRRVRSWFRITEPEMRKIIEFLKTCGGFEMP